MVKSSTPRKPGLRTGVPDRMDSGQSEIARKKKRRVYWYCAFFLVWLVVGTGLFFHMWENRQHYGNAFSVIDEDV